jgi:hypothetical protein
VVDVVEIVVDVEDVVVVEAMHGVHPDKVPAHLFCKAQQ